MLQFPSLTASLLMDFPGGSSGKEVSCQCRRHKRCRLGHWVGRIPWTRAWLSTPVFLPGNSPWTEEPGGLQSIGSQSWAGLKRLSAHTRFLIMVQESIEKQHVAMGFTWWLPFLLDEIGYQAKWKKTKTKKKLALPDSEVLEVMALLKTSSYKSLVLRMVVVV